MSDGDLDKKNHYAATSPSHLHVSWLAELVRNCSKGGRVRQNRGVQVMEWVHRLEVTGLKYITEV